MSGYLTGLSVTAASIGGASYLATLEEMTLTADNTTVDARGIADRYPFKQAVKQTQKYDFVTQVTGTTVDTKASNLDITAWAFGGTAYLGQVKSGTISCSTGAVNRAGVAVFDEYLQAELTDCTITTDLMVVNAAIFTPAMLSDVGSGFATTVSIVFAGKTVAVPMIFKASSHSTKKGELQMENVNMELRGTPTGPSDTSLLGNILLGTAVVALSAALGGNTYSGTGLITKLDTQFAEAALIKQTGTIEAQGGLTAA